MSNQSANDKIDAMEERLLRSTERIEAHMASMEARISRQLNRMVIIVLAGLAAAVGIILRFG